jgi:uncharacterized membrane protein YqjE
VTSALTGSGQRLGASLVDFARQRLELAALDIEEEALRLLALEALLLAGAVFGLLTLAALAATVIVLLWDSARYLALGGVTACFAAATLACGWRLRAALRSKPAFLATTLDELRQDLRHLRAVP